MPTRVAIVEDDPLIRAEIAARIATEPAFELAGEAGTVAAARALLVGSRASVLLLDLGLPDGSGLSLIEPARAREMAVLVLTVEGGDAAIFEAIALGASGYLLKSEAIATLGDSLRSLMEGGSPISPRIARRVLEALRRRHRSNAASVLTVREREVIELFAGGATYNDVGRALGVSVNTVRQHVRNTYEKLHVSSKAEAVAILRQ